MVVLERYPDLKANQNFLSLQDELSGTENRIAVERRRYNTSVRDYNVVVRRFPSNIVASITGFEKGDLYFEAKDGAQEPPKVQF
jgi:LemA protein